MSDALHTTLLAAADQSLQPRRDGIQGLVRVARAGLATGKDQTEVVAAVNLAILTMAAAGMAVTEIAVGMAIAVVRIAELEDELAKLRGEQ